tara:strand:- start:51 stop:680 length:630 start_codon:yes stop_codon:yes gene_type:complete
MKLTRKKLRRLIAEEVDLLLEQDIFAEPEEEEGGADEEATAEDQEETEGEEEGAEAEEEAEEEEEEVEPPDEEALSLAKTVDDELTALFVDFETDALQVGKMEEETVEETRRPKLVNLLFEQEEMPALDMETFASDVARLAQNYDSLLDMKAIIMKKAEDYITSKYDAEKAQELMDILDLRYDLSLEIDEDEIAPMAAGASVTAAEGGV